MKKRAMVRTMCYKTKEPVYYNKGTEYETTHDEFLAYCSYETFEKVAKEAERLNREKPERNKLGHKIDWNEVDYFFASEQEEF